MSTIHETIGTVPRPLSTLSQVPEVHHTPSCLAYIYLTLLPPTGYSPGAYFPCALIVPLIRLSVFSLRKD